MEDLIVEGGKSTPSISFRAQEHRLELKGDSYPENAASFYAPVFQWLQTYINTLEGNDVVVDLEISYFNSSSSKVLMDFFDLLDQAASKGNAITINWRYHADNEMALEYGEEFKEDLTDVQFNLVEFSD